MKYYYSVPKPYLWQGEGASPQRIAAERDRNRSLLCLAYNRRCAKCKAKGAPLAGHWVDKSTIRSRFLCEHCYREHLASLVAA